MAGLQKIRDGNRILVDSSAESTQLEDQEGDEIILR
jgi:hypothetical protein